MTKARRIAFWVAGGLLVLTGAGLAIAATLLQPLDQEVVVHWNIAGEPDRWGPAWTYLVVIGVTGVALAAIALMIGLFKMRDPEGVVDPEPIELAPGEVAVWTRTATAAPGFYWAVGLGIAFSIAASVAVVLATSGRGWPVVILPVTLLVLLAATGGWRVSAGPSGLTVRGLFGLPVMRVPVDDIERVVAVGVHPMRDFGGWGIRGAIGPTGHWRTGVVVRAGDAIEITRRSGKQFVVTVDDAATGAAVLKAAAASFSTSGILSE